ncbi:two-component system response regulator [Paraburkholderia monticola]|uniref:Two-component system response regulator n=1 Tax=Paraburkholderia monticola TaxID=1399968 RepID=A0A149PBZ1_9BURK|nr:response regulator transcription factor [Paraburkholderia monticola]KXU82544.1 two-component system response regulator [Paraburkholderia monticola]
MNILLIEDDPTEAQAVYAALHRDHDISRVGSGEEAVRFLRGHPVDLVIVDWQLPRMSGLDLLQWIRNTLGDEPAVLFLTGRLFDVDIVRALEAGADEYVFKPARAPELAARVNALARRIAKQRKIADLLCIGDYTLNLTDRSISLRDRPISLTVKEFTLIAHFFENANKIVSRDSLASLGWGRDLNGTSRTIDTHMYRLRRKLALKPENGVRLTAIYMHGYRFDEVRPRIASNDANTEKEADVENV